MGIYIEHEQMPRNCTECFYAERCTKCKYGEFIKNTEIIFRINSKPKDCPLTEINNDKIKQLL